MLFRSLGFVAGVAIGIARTQDNAGPRTWTKPDGTVVTEADVAYKEAHDACEMHHPDPPLIMQNGIAVKNRNEFWPEPCGEAERRYDASGAKAKFDAVERYESARTLEAIQRAVTQ